MAEAGGATLARESQAVHAAALRASKTAARRERDQVVVNDSAEGNLEPDVQAQFSRNRFADRQSNGVGFAPVLNSYGGDQDLAEELGEEESEEAFEEEMFDLQQQSRQQGRAEDSSRVRSMMRKTMDDHEDEMMKKAMEELKKFLKKRQFDVAAKGTSLVDQAEFLELMDAVGVSASTLQLVITIFKDSIPEDVRKKLPIQPLEPAKSMADVAALAAYAPQILWFSLKVILVVIAPFILPLIAAGACASSTACQAAYGSVSSLVTSFF